MDMILFITTVGFEFRFLDLYGTYRMSLACFILFVVKCIRVDVLQACRPDCVLVYPLPPSGAVTPTPHQKKLSRKRIIHGDIYPTDDAGTPLLLPNHSLTVN